MKPKYGEKAKLYYMDADSFEWANKMLPIFDRTQVFEMKTYSKSLFTDFSQSIKLTFDAKGFPLLSLLFDAVQ